MKLMTNIVKLSYISIATIEFTTHAPPRPLARATYSRGPSLVRHPRNLISQDQASVSYLKNPEDMNKSSMSMIKDDESVDKEAWDFIKKVTEKNLKDASEITNLSEFIFPPPPPRIMMQSSSAY